MGRVIDLRLYFAIPTLIRDYFRHKLWEALLGSTNKIISQHSLNFMLLNVAIYRTLDSVLDFAINCCRLFIAILAKLFKKAASVTLQLFVLTLKSSTLCRTLMRTQFHHVRLLELGSVTNELTNLLSHL